MDSLTRLRVARGAVESNYFLINLERVDDVICFMSLPVE